MSPPKYVLTFLPMVQKIELSGINDDLIGMNSIMASQKELEKTNKTSIVKKRSIQP